MPTSATTKILVAEDDPLTSQLVVFKLKQFGFTVLTAATGEAALNLTRSEKPDLILLDGLMPIMDGFEVLRRIRETPEVKDIPVIMLTIKNKDADIITGLDLGAVDYIVKPFRPVELLARIRKHLKSSVDASGDGGSEAGSDI